MAEIKTKDTTLEVASEEPKESKGALKKREKEEAKAAAQAERDAAAAAKSAEALSKIQGSFGPLPLVQSKTHHTKTYTKVGELTAALAGQQVLVRARLATLRVKGKLGFLVLRQTPNTVQCVISENEAGVPREAIKWVGSLNPESVVDVCGTLEAVPAPIQTCTQTDVELHITSLFLVTTAPETLPFQLEDASRREFSAAEQAKLEEEAVAAGKKGAMTTTVGMDHRLNNRWLDLRTRANHAIFNLQHRVGHLFRRYLESQGFMEIHSPKLIGSASEGSGATVFKVKYFESNAFLAQSPQLYKQMSLMCDFDRVFEIGPVFRAENSNTHRHLCEYVGLDMEMCIYEHYYEVLDVAEEMFHSIFKGLSTEYRHFVDMVREQYPVEDIVWQVPAEKIAEFGMEVIEGGGPSPVRDAGKVRNMDVRSLRLDFVTGVAMVNAKLATLRPLSREDLLEQFGIKVKNDFEHEKALADMGLTDDLSTQNEKLLGKVVKEKYGVDFYILDKYPSTVRPFYTMPHPEDPKYTNSYDMFIRGEEIVSGAQRIHDAELLLKRAESLGVDLTPISDYVDSFRLGAFPHGGMGVGLERVVMLFLGLHNIRYVSLFPRTPDRCAP